jgi:hypothetical protein
MEAVYRKLTGEFVVFSKQYFIDCTFRYSGCAGGTVNEGYKLTKDRQYLMSEEDWPLTTECEYSGTCTGNETFWPVYTFVIVPDQKAIFLTLI